VLKRFQLQLSVRINGDLPPDFADRFTVPGRRRFNAAFASRARRYRLSNRIVIALLIGFGLGLFVAVKLPVLEKTRLWIAVAFALFLSLAIVIHLSNLRLRCPSCRKKITPATGPYCPQCGADSSCQCRIEEASGDDARSYRVRGCTHCGVFLDEQGL